MTIDELIKKAHAQAKSMGWWDEPRNTGELLMLIVSECGEALEAHRNGRRADMERVGERYASFLETWTMCPPELIDELQTPDEFMMLLFREHIKDTFEDELADIVIRIADLCGRHNIVPSCPPDGSGGANISTKNAGQDLLGVTKSVCQLFMYETDTVGDWNDCAGAALIGVFSMANEHNIDLWRHIELKLAYNLTRGRKHGKAY